MIRPSAKPSSLNEDVSNLRKQYIAILDNRCKWESSFSRPLRRFEQKEQSRYPSYVLFQEAGDPLQEVSVRPSCAVSNMLKDSLELMQPRGSRYFYYVDENSTDVASYGPSAYIANTNDLENLAQVFLALISPLEDIRPVYDIDILQAVSDSYAGLKEVKAVFYCRYFEEDQFTVLADDSQYSESVYDELIQREMNLLNKFQNKYLLVSIVWGKLEDLTPEFLSDAYILFKK